MKELSNLNTKPIEVNVCKKGSKYHNMNGAIVGVQKAMTDNGTERHYVVVIEIGIPQLQYDYETAVLLLKREEIHVVDDVRWRNFIANMTDVLSQDDTKEVN